ncbi:MULTISPECIES: hypothetical protein [unclassified Rickettsia]|uniref:hypothetical protein n=1 Tax=unclassified Rickettsia TaxID=114295 RepID=UPI003132D856
MLKQVQHNISKAGFPPAREWTSKIRAMQQRRSSHGMTISINNNLFTICPTLHY